MAKAQVETAPTQEERQAWRAAAVRLVRQYPDPALRVAAAPVGAVDADVRALIERMTDVMTRSHGVGLAAPQIGVLRRVFVYRTDAEERPRALVDPRIVEHSEETASDAEGCLSLLGGELVVPVMRAVSVSVAGLDPRGEPVEYEAEGLPARVIQHELDHLDGVLIIDRTDPEERRRALRELRLRAV
jgi:peptide deformylase